MKRLRGEPTELIQKKKKKKIKHSTVGMGLHTVPILTVGKTGKSQESEQSVSGEVF